MHAVVVQIKLHTKQYIDANNMRGGGQSRFLQQLKYYLKELNQTADIPQL